MPKLLGECDSYNGEIVQLSRNGGEWEDWRVVHQGRPSDLYSANFESGTILMRKDALIEMQFGTNDSDYLYENSLPRSYLENEFYLTFDPGIRNQIMEVKVPYFNDNSIVKSGEEGLPVKIKMASAAEISLTSTNLANGAFVSKQDGTVFNYFKSGAKAKRIVSYNGTNIQWWTTSLWQYGLQFRLICVRVDGDGAASYANNSFYVVSFIVLPSILEVDDDGKIIANQPPSTPPSITIPPTANSNQNITISWEASTDPDGDDITYILERSANDEGFVEIADVSTTTYDDTILEDWNIVVYRVKARDSFGNDSDYVTSTGTTIIHNNAPEISGENGDLGVMSSDFTFNYTITDIEDNAVEVTEIIDNEIVVRTFTPPLGVEQTMNVASRDFTRLSNGAHFLEIKAVDETGGTTVRRMTFTKHITNFVIWPRVPKKETSTLPKRMIADKVDYVLAPGASLKIEACNNGFDENPVWEDVTSILLNNLAYVFENKIQTAPKAGVNIRVSMDRKDAVGECVFYGIEGIDYQ